jgi:hypothetical protein
VHQDIDAEKITKPLSFTRTLFSCLILSPQQQTNPKGNTMKLSKKNAERIATLFNTISVAEHMIREGYDYARWRANAVQAAQTLQDEYGIKVIGY